jgi:hypothetical protein
VGFSNNHGYSWTELGGLVNLDPLVPGIDITYVADSLTRSGLRPWSSS